MPKRDDNDEVVQARFRSVLAADPPIHDAFADRSPVSWSELIPSWPDDVDLPDQPPDQPPESPPDPPGPGPRAPADLAAMAAVRQPWRPAAAEDPGDAPPRLGAAGAFGGRLAAFDLGRPGVKALAAVAALVVIIAGFLAWRARPQTETLAPDEPKAPAAVKHDEQDPMAIPPPSGSASAQVVVAVAGKVARPGLVTLPAGARVADALAAAGGARRGVDPGPLNLARKVVDGELIMVGAPPPSVAVAVAPGAAPGGPLNLNTATVADLDTLPGVGPVLAQRILEARDAQGGFKAVGDLRKVSGIGSSRFEQLKDLVTV
ncbi:ComEA family DNA-binding protein [Actinoplanes sp. NPDC051470]|uniref:ComEA family DNA-binding protein n=1 Tax=Actinoplanes sp. NPDC051470 TaxID=3157224 RepID=UPI0034394CA2